MDNKIFDSFKEKIVNEKSFKKWKIYVKEWLKTHNEIEFTSFTKNIITDLNLDKEKIEFKLLYNNKCRNGIIKREKIIDNKNKKIKLITYYTNFDGNIKKSEKTLKYYNKK